jgi:hypothetical protein
MASSGRVFALFYRNFNLCRLAGRRFIRAALYRSRHSFYSFAASFVSFACLSAYSMENGDWDIAHSPIDIHQCERSDCLMEIHQQEPIGCRFYQGRRIALAIRRAGFKRLKIYQKNILNFVEIWYN